MDISLCFDVEDYTSPPEAGMDDIPKWLSEIMSEEGVIGSFLVMGGKAESLLARGRHDVINAMRKHEIGFHTTFGSEHPTLTEALAPLDWQEAVKLANLREVSGFKRLGEIFQTEIGSWSSHGASQTEAIRYVSGQLQQPWLYSYIPCPVEGLCWYSGSLQYAWDGIGISESAYSDRAAVDATLARWEKEVERMDRAGRRWACCFMAHPLMIRAKQFNDALNFADGQTRFPFKTPELRSLEEMEIAKVQFRRVIRWIKNNPKLRVRTLQETYKAFCKSKKSITRAELALYAAHCNGQIRTGYPFSPAEALLAMADGLLQKTLPESCVVRPIQGPLGESIRVPDNALAYLGATEIKTLAQGLLQEAEQTGHLPSVLAVPNGAGRMGLPTIFHALTVAWLQVHAGQKEISVRVLHICDRYPDGADLVEASARAKWLNWPIHDIHMPLEKISQQVRLQSWTWKRIYDGNDAPRRFEPIGVMPPAWSPFDSPAH